MASKQENDEVDTAFVKTANSLLVIGPIVQLLMIVVVTWLGYAWVSKMIEYSPIAMAFGQTRTHTDVMLRTQSWLIFVTMIFMIIQIAGALVMSFNLKVIHVLSIGLSVIPMIVLLYAIFCYWHLGLKLDEMQRIFLWFAGFSVITGFLMGLWARMAILSAARR